MRTYTYDTANGDFPKWIDAHQDCECLVLRGTAIYGGKTDTVHSMNMALEVSKIKVIDILDFRILSAEDKYKDLWELEQIDAGQWIGSVWDDYPIGVLEKMVLNRDYATCFVWESNLLMTEDMRTVINFRHQNDNQVTKITIPANVENIGRYAFMGVEDLPLFEILGALKVIDAAAFYDCYGLHIPLPNTLERLGAWAFGESDIYNIVIPPKIDTLPTGCFQSCMSFDESSLAHVRHIGDMAFESCYVNEIHLPEGVETIGRYAFTGVSFIHLPASLRAIDKGFYLDEEWEEQSIPYVDVAIDNPVFYSKNGTLYKVGDDEPYLGSDFVPEQKKQLLLPKSDFGWERKLNLEELKERYYSVSPVNSEQTMFHVWNGKERYYNIIDCYGNEYLDKNLVKNIDVSFDHFIIVNLEAVYSIDMKELLMDASTLEFDITGCDNEGRIYVREGIVIDDFYAPLFPDEPLPQYWCIDIDGNPLLKNKYNDLGHFDAEGLAPACIGKLWGMIDIDENVVIPFAYKSIEHFDNEGMAKVSKGSKKGYVDKQSNLVIPFRYNYFENFDKDGFAYAIIYKGKDAGGYFVNRKGEELGKFQPRYENEDVYQPCFHLFFNNGKFGYCKQFAHEFTECIYQDIRVIDDRCIEVSMNGVDYQRVYY